MANKNKEECKSMTKPIKVAFLSKAGIKLRIPKRPMTKPIRIAFLSRTPKRRPKRKEEE
ncbi:hypothetical protein ES704_01416 [subsurface metagenome]|jgi:hypothetical protein